MWSKPKTQSVSALVSMMPSMGVLRSAAVGANSESLKSCWRRSGEALRSNQVVEDAETATCVCVRGWPFSTPCRKRLQFEHPQFHCGKPPPAAEPRTLTRIQNYSSAFAYELTSQLRQISSCWGVVHSMVVPPVLEPYGLWLRQQLGRNKKSIAYLTHLRQLSFLSRVSRAATLPERFHRQRNSTQPDSREGPPGPSPSPWTRI